MRRILTILPALLALTSIARPEPDYSLRQVLSSPFPGSLTAARTGARIAWVFDREGRRSLWVAEGPAFSARELVAPAGDDGRGLSIVGFSHDGAVIVFARGGAFNPDQDPRGAGGTRLFRVPFAGGAPVEIASTGSGVLSPTAPRLVYASGGTVYEVPLDGLLGRTKSRQVCKLRGTVSQLRWSPDGTKLAMTSTRRSTDERYGFVAVYDFARRKITYLDPAIYRDSAPQWSPDGRRIAFRRRLTAGGESVNRARTFPQPDPWQIRVTDLETGKTHDLFRTPERGSYRWARHAWIDDERLVVRSERDGWLRLYAVPASGGRGRALTPANAIAQEFTVKDGAVFFTTNADDIDRRHIWKATREKTAPVAPIRATLEWSPVVTGDGRYLAYLASDARSPAHVYVRKLAGGDARKLAPETLPKDFPVARMVVPEQVVMRAQDGVRVHGQLFRPPARFKGRRPAVMYFHGGPVRQMVLGWHYRGYYHKCYALNQYLASRGYVVLSVNYRLGIGYGKKFRDVSNGGPRGASEYQDLLAGAAYLRGRPDVDPGRVGLWGGSYGGLMTALGLARNSDLFAAGVDLHGVHDWTQWQAWSREGEVEQNRTAWKSSPVADLASWRSPVLLIHGDDDKNVPFSETIWLDRELTERGIPHERLVFPDEVHSFLRHANWLKAFERAADFFDRKLRDKATPHARIRTGPARYEFDVQGTRLEVFTYKPKGYRGERMILVMHGTLRNADDYRDHAQAMGDRFGALIVAPRFDRRRFSSLAYHFGGILARDGRAAPPSEWTYAYLPKLVGAVRAMEEKPSLPFWVIGHSAGGQFVARMAAFFDPGAERLVAANPGSELFPTRDLPFGYGFGRLPDELGDDATLRRYLAAPLTLYLGTEDNHPDRYFDKSESAMRQGAGRLQRGRACYAMAKELAEKKGWPFRWRIVEAKDVGHDHEKMFNHAACADALFGKEPAKTPAGGG